MAKKPGPDVLADFLRNAGLEPIHIDPLNEQRLLSHCEFVDRGRSSREAGYYLERGLAFDPKLLGLLGFAAISAPTFGACIRLLAVHLPVSRDVGTLEIVERKDFAVLAVKFKNGRISLPFMEFFSGLVFRLTARCTGDRFKPQQIWFEKQLPSSDAEVFGRLLDAPVLMGQPYSGLAFSHELFEHPTISADGDLSEFLLELFLSRRQCHAEAGGFAAKLRELIRSRIGDSQLTVDSLASEIGLSKWMFRRLLRDEGVRFTDLVTTVKKEIANELLGNPDTPLTEIALSLGYSELSAFSRAYRQWTGISPQQYRLMRRPSVR